MTMASRPCASTSSRAYQRYGGYHHDNTSFLQPYQNDNNLTSNFAIQPGNRIQALPYAFANSVDYFGAPDVQICQSSGRSDISPPYPAWQARFSEWNDEMPDSSSNYACPNSPSRDPLVSMADFSTPIEYSTFMDSMWDYPSPQSDPSGTIALEAMHLDFPEVDQMLSSDSSSTAHMDQMCVDPFETSRQSQQIDRVAFWDFTLDNSNQPFQDTPRVEITTPKLPPAVIFDHCKQPPP
jgi:hypothetical protein